MNSIEVRHRTSPPPHSVIDMSDIFEPTDQKIFSKAIAICISNNTGPIIVKMSDITVLSGVSILKTLEEAEKLCQPRSRSILLAGCTQSTINFLNMYDLTESRFFRYRTLDDAINAVGKNYTTRVK